MNLATQTENTASGDGFSFSGGGLLGVLVVFLLVLAAWGGITVANKMTVSKIENVRSQYATKYNDFTRSNAKEVIDFKNRLEFARDSKNKGVSIKETLDKIETLLLPAEVWLGEYKYDAKNKTITLSCRARNYDLVARQILSFKNSDYFASASGGETKLDGATGVISFDVDLVLK